jgi:hypothetical protein
MAIKPLSILNIAITGSRNWLPDPVTTYNDTISTRWVAEGLAILSAP